MGSLSSSRQCLEHDAGRTPTGRRTEIYLYFDLGPQIVVHLMGEPRATRHLIVATVRSCYRPRGRSTPAPARATIASVGRWAATTRFFTTWIRRRSANCVETAAGFLTGRQDPDSFHPPGPDLIPHLFLNTMSSIIDRF